MLVPRALDKSLQPRKEGTTEGPKDRASEFARSLNSYMQNSQKNDYNLDTQEKKRNSEDTDTQQYIFNVSSC